VNPALAGVALAVVAGAAIAVSAGNARTATFGLVIALILAPVVADPIPEAIGLAARLVGAVLAGYLLWIATRGERVQTSGSLIGWPTELFLAAAAAVVGVGVYDLGVPFHGPAPAAAAGFVLVALAVVPLVSGRDILRIGIGLALLLTGSLLVVTSLVGTPDELEQVLIAGLVASLGGTVAVLVAAGTPDERARPDGPGQAPETQ
jgi:hypothetical protein